MLTHDDERHRSCSCWWTQGTCGPPGRTTSAAPHDPGIHDVRTEVFSRRATHELSTMTKGIFTWAANQSRQHATERH
jgi:hypothetical protein